MSTTTVLVTGATGFIAKHCVAELLRTGHAVRGTVRAAHRGEAVRSAMAAAGVTDASRLSFAVADLTGDEGWAEAMTGVSHVLHVASPFPMSFPRDREQLIGPARDGTARVIRAAATAGVRRVVVTSSMVACVYPSAGPQARAYTEADWTDPARGDISPYVVSKTLAEQAAWDLIASLPQAPELAVINPGFVQGPALDADLSTSHKVLVRMGRGEFPAAPRAGYAIADVRDIARAHVAAMTNPAAAGQRFLVANGFLSFLEMGRIMGEALPHLARRMPRFELPDLLVRGMALADRSLAAVLPDLGTRRTCDAGKARDVLGLAFTSAPEALASAALSLRRLGLV